MVSQEVLLDAKSSEGSDLMQNLSQSAIITSPSIERSDSYEKNDTTKRGPDCNLQR